MPVFAALRFWENGKFFIGILIIGFFFYFCTMYNIFHAHLYVFIFSIILDKFCDPTLECLPCVQSQCDFYANREESACVAAGTVPRGTFDVFVGSSFLDGCPPDSTRKPGPNPPAYPTTSEDPAASTTEMDSSSIFTTETPAPTKPPQLQEESNPWLYLLTVAGNN